MLTLYRSREELEAESCERAERVCERLGSAVVRLSPDEIRLPDTEIRDETDASLARLADSVGRYGLLEPLIVRHTEQGEIELVFGARRLRAARLAALTSVPCVFTESEPSERAELYAAAVLSQRGLSPFEEAGAILAALKESGASRTELARRLSCSPLWLAERLCLASCDAEMRQRIVDTGLSERHVRALLRLPSDDQRQELLGYISERGISAAATEALVERLVSGCDRVTERRRMKGAVGDLRLFYNSIERALLSARRAGLSVSCKRSERQEETVLVIRVGADPLSD